MKAAFGIFIAAYCGATFAADMNSKLAYNAAAPVHRKGYISTFQDAIPHFAAGGDWVTSLAIMNFRTEQVRIGVAITGDDGYPLAMPLADIGVTSSFNVVLPPNGTTVLETEYRPSDPMLWGMVRLNIPCDSYTSCGTVGAFATLKWRVANMPVQEAVAQSVPSDETTTCIAFENRNGYVTGVAISQPKFYGFETGTSAVTLTFRDGSGARLLVDQMDIPAGGHTAFVLTDRYPQLAGKQGSLEVSSSDYVSALAFLFNPTGAFSTSPSWQPK